MKPIAGFFIVAVLVLALAACASQKSADRLEKSEINVDGFEKTEYTDLSDVGITMSLKDKAVTTKTESIMIEYANATDIEYTFGKKPHLEIASGDDWYVVPAKGGWEDVGIMLLPYGNKEYVFPLEYHYEGLIPGHYRVIKMFYADGNSVAAAVEFDIADGDD